MTFKDLKKRISSSEQQQQQQQQTQSFDKLQNKPFWIWDQQQHRLEDIKTNGYCCFNHRTDVSPKVFILAVRTCGNPTFNSHLFSVAVTPNPAKDYFILDINTEQANSDVKLIDITGRVVLSEKVDKEDVSTTLELHGLAAGTYTLVVESGSDYYLEKLVIIE